MLNPSEKLVRNKTFVNLILDEVPVVIIGDCIGLIAHNFLRWYLTSSTHFRYVCRLEEYVNKHREQLLYVIGDIIDYSQVGLRYVALTIVAYSLLFILFLMLILL